MTLTIKVGETLRRKLVESLVVSEKQTKDEVTYVEGRNE